MNTNPYKFSNSEAAEFATKTSKTVTVRNYDNGNSNDQQRYSTEHEEQRIYIAIMAALLAINNGSEVKSTIDTTEYMILCDPSLDLPNQQSDLDEDHINTYDTIELPIRAFLAEHETAI